MFENEVCTGMKYIPRKHLVRNCSKILQCVRRVCKYYIKFLPAYFKKLEYIMSYDRQVPHTESGSLGFDEIGMEGKHLDTIYHRSASGCEFIRNGSGTAKEIQNIGTRDFKLN